MKKQSFKKVWMIKLSGHCYQWQRVVNMRNPGSENSCLRRVSLDVTIISEDLKKADLLLHIAMAEEALAEVTGNYVRAQKSYAKAYYTLNGISGLASKAPAVYGGLLYTIQDRIKIAQTGVLEIQIRKATSTHYRSNKLS